MLTGIYCISHVYDIGCNVGSSVIYIGLDHHDLMIDIVIYKCASVNK